MAAELISDEDERVRRTVRRWLIGQGGEAAEAIHLHGPRCTKEELEEQLRQPV